MAWRNNRDTDDGGGGGVVNRLDAAVLERIDQASLSGAGFTLGILDRLAPVERPGVDMAGLDPENRAAIVAAFEDAEMDGEDALAALASGHRAVSVNVVQNPPAPDLTERPADLRRHTLMDVASLVDYLETHGTKTKSIVLVSDDGISAVLDDEPQTNAREIIQVAWQRHQDLMAWSTILAQTDPISHKDLLRFCLRHAHTLADADVVQALRSIKITNEVVIDSDIREDAGSQAVAFKTTAGNEFKKFPRAISVQVPILADDPADGVRPFQVRLAVVMPERAEQGIRFYLTSPDIRRVVRARIDAEIQTLRERLAGWLIVRGQHGYQRRPVGCKENGLTSGLEE